MGVVKPGMCYVKVLHHCGQWKCREDVLNANLTELENGNFLKKKTNKFIMLILIMQGENSQSTG